MKLVVLFVIYFIYANYQVVARFGKCPEINNNISFDISKFTGSWYEIKRTNNLAQKNTKCNTINFAYDKDKTIFTHNRGVDITTNIPKSSVGLGKQSDDIPSMYVGNFNTITPKASYRVLKTDYRSYALIYTCHNFLLIKKEEAWILSRTPTLDPAIISNLMKFLVATTNRTFDASRLFKTNQNDCPEYGEENPEP